VKTLDARYVIGVGRFAEQRARHALAGRDVVLGAVPHPSPASPQANRGWTALMDRALAEIGVLPSPRRRASPVA
jgi:single-strand selective monofunctional uracil DNA glycosylase